MIPLFKVRMADAAPSLVGSVLTSGYIGQGLHNDVFERELATHLPGPPVLTNSCTSAIHMVLSYLGVGPGDEVITTPLTCIATNAPILSLGARPVWADVDEVTGNIKVDDVLDKVTSRTKAVIGVDWTGRVADYKKLRRSGVPVIQDAAHGPLLVDYAREALGDFICFSFGPIKHLTSGDGGAVVCDPEHREALRLLRWYGLDRTSQKDFRCEQNITRAGLKWHMSDINAAIGRANLPGLWNAVQAHMGNAAYLYARIKQSDVTLPPWDKRSNYWVFPILVDARRRDRFKRYMEDNGVACSQVHARNDKHTAYDFPNGPLPGLNKFANEQLNLPCGWWLNEADLDRIIRLVNAFS